MDESKQTPKEDYYEGMPTPPGPDMTRGVQTAWIVGAIIMVGLAVAWFHTRLPDGAPNKECQGIIFMDTNCVAMNAVRRWGG